MAKIKKFNSDLDQIESLRDALVDLSDARLVRVFQLKQESSRSRTFPTIRIAIELKDHWRYDILDNRNKYKPEDFKLFMISNDEKSNIINLVKEGLVRSNIDYIDLKFQILYSNFVYNRGDDFFDFMGFQGSDEMDNFCNSTSTFMVFYINLDRV